MTRSGVIIIALISACGVLPPVARADGHVPPASAGGGFERAVSSALPRVVKLYGLRAGREPGFASGIIVSADGLVLTVFSLLIDARDIRAVAWDGTPYDARVVDRDWHRQLALLQLVPVSGAVRVEAGSAAPDPTEGATGGSSAGAGGPSEPHIYADPARGETSGVETRGSLGLPFFDLSHKAILRPGDWVLAAGNPFKIATGAESVSVLHGVFSARTRLDARRRLKDFPYHGDVLVIDAITSNPGAAGSALVNLDGELVGMIGREVISNLTHTHFNYGMPRDVLYEYFLEAVGRRERPDARVTVLSPHGSRRRSPTPADLGLRISRVGYRRILPFVEHVRPGSPADKAGARKDDLILSVNGRSVPDTAVFDARMEMLAPDDPVDLVVRRNNTIVSIRIEEVAASEHRSAETSSRNSGDRPETQLPGDGALVTKQAGSQEETETTERPGRVPAPSSGNASTGGALRDAVNGRSDAAAQTPSRPTIDDPQSTLAVVRATQEAFRAVAAKLRPSLVRIETVGGSQPPERLLFGDDEEEPAPTGPRRSPFRDTPGSSFTVADGPTTGIVYEPDGYIVTSSFNFVREPILITATLWDGRRLAAELVARDQVRKIALLKVDATELPVPQWGDPTDLHVGQWAIALGLGFGGDEPSVTVGIVSALDRMRGNAVQADAKLSPANYGGPLCDVHGRVIGICVPMAQRPGELAGIELYDSGIGFAVPKRLLDEIVDVLKTGRSLYRGWLGIQISANIVDGVVIRRIADPSPMLAAGVMAGDRILTADGKPVRNFGDLMHALYMVPAGESVDLQMERDGSGYEIAVTLARSADLGPLPED